MNKWFRKINLVILLSFIAVLMFVVVMLYGFNKNKFNFLKKNHQTQLQTQTVTKEPKLVRTDYTDVARKTLDWIDKQRNEDGWYILGRICGQEDCEIVIDDREIGNKDGLITTWARLNFYEQHKDPKDLEIVKKDIDFFYNKYKDDNLKDSLWLCKITYEMAQSKYLDKIQKDKLKELCLKKEIVSFDNDTLEREKNNLIKNNDFNKGMSFPYYFLVFHGLYPDFGNVSDYYYKYKFTNNLNYFRKAKEEQIKLTNFINDEVSVFNQCLIGIGTLDLFGLSKSKDNLDDVIDTYNKIKEDKEVVFDPFCGLLIKELYKITNDSKYLFLLEENNKLLIENYNEYGLDSFFVSPNTYPKRDVIMNSLFVEIVR